MPQRIAHPTSATGAASGETVVPLRKELVHPPTPRPLGDPCGLGSIQRGLRSCPAKNVLDGNSIFFENDLGMECQLPSMVGFLVSVATVRDLDLPNALRDEFRVYVDHGGPAVRDIPGPHWAGDPPATRSVAHRAPAPRRGACSEA